MPELPEVSELLGATLPHLVPQRIVEHGCALVGGPIAVYVIDLDGSRAILLAGDRQWFPNRIVAPVGVGPEVAMDALEQLRGFVADRVGAHMFWPMVVRDRIMGFLICRDEPRGDLGPLAARAGIALELASGYTDLIAGARRRKDIEPAAEIQQNLLPPRLARVDGADVAGGVLPGYEVGGDFFDYACNADGLWLAVADAAGKGNSAAALSSLAVGALRAARRAGAGLEEIARLLDDTVLSLEMDRYLTALLGVWEPASHELRWINCGHPPPLVRRVDGRIEELAGEHTYPLGMNLSPRTFPILRATIDVGDRLLLYSDGVSERRTTTGDRFGTDAIATTLAERSAHSAATVVRRLQDAVIGAAVEPLRDDATLLALVPHDS